MHRIEQRFEDRSGSSSTLAVAAHMSRVTRKGLAVEHQLVHEDRTMSKTVDPKHDGPVGSGVVLSNPSPNVLFKTYVADRPAPTGVSWGAEMVVDVTISLAYPVRTVWRAFKNFNRWMTRFGYEWDEGVLADREDSLVYLGNRPGANDLKWRDDLRIKYIVRKVVPERLIYFDSPPAPIENPAANGLWTGHNVMSLHEDGKHTKIVIFMEHTWYSDTMSIEDLRGEAKSTMEGGVAFWCDYFIPDLIAAVEADSRASI